MKRSTLFRWAAVFTLMIATVSSTASAQEGDTLTINGEFHAWWVEGIPGPDLYDVYLNGQTHTWTLTMQGVTYENDYAIVDRGDGNYDEQYITRARATSFVLEFFGPDETTLNSVVSEPLTEVVVELVNGGIYEYDYPVVQHISFSLQLLPANPSDGVGFSVVSDVSTEEPYTPGYLTFHPQDIYWTYETIVDQRFGGYGEIQSYSPGVYIGSPVPPPPTYMSIADGSVQEGSKGTRALSLTLSLTIPRSETVTVQYQTSDGTAKSSGTKTSPADFKAATGTVTFLPGQTIQTISILVNGDRIREANETFTVTLSNPTGATISDGVATATILNDD